MNSDKESGKHQEKPNTNKNNNDNNNNNNNNPELTAEWTVRAQLTISHPGVNASSSSSKTYDQQSQQHQQTTTQNPVQVIYKWSSDDIKPTTTNIPGVDRSPSKSGSFRQTYRTSSATPKQHDSFHSTTGHGKPPSDSGFSSSNTPLNSQYGTRCRSTCSIVLSAVADFLPSQTTETPEETDPFYFNTATASYTLSPDKACDENINASQNFGGTKILALRDAFSQTSDTESRRQSSTYYQQQHAQQTDYQYSPKTVRSPASSISESKDGRKRKQYDYRRITDSMLPPPPTVEEGDTFKPSYSLSSPARTTYTGSSSVQTASTGRTVLPVQPPTVTQSVSRSSSQKNESATGKKPPRTVHIDVYCTGSDAGSDDDDDDGDGDDDDTTSSSENINELESNSTPQTVFDTEQMLLRHQRAGKTDLPRRFLNQSNQQQQKSPQQYPQTQRQFSQSKQSIQQHDQIGHAITKSTTADEISESKQILFKKHIGDQRNSKYNFRNRFRKDPSDDCLSSNYPNSSRSTMRDMTCSSISSAIASNSAIYEDIETSWKETEPDLTTVTSLAKSDSFEYDNSIDRLRIQRMENLWSNPDDEYDKSSPSGDSPNKQTSVHHQKRIHEFLQSYRLPTGIIRHHPHDSLLSEYENLSETDHSYFDRNTIPEKDEPNDFSNEPSPILVHSHRLTIPPSPTATTTVSDNNRGNVKSGFSRVDSESRSPERPSRVLFSADYNKSGSETSTLQSNLSGYTTEYLAKARKFGAVVTALRKPGHHVGPAKNPECQCEHCRRWLSERNGGFGRGRAFSCGDTPNTRSGFWLQRAGLI